MQFVWGHEDIIANWIVRQIDDPVVVIGECRTLGLALADELIAAVAYANFRELPHGNDLEMVFAAKSPRWATREALYRIFDYPFNAAGCSRVTAIVRAKNRSIRRLLAGESSDRKTSGLGFKREGVVRQGWDGKQNAVVYGMTRKEAQRWLNWKSRGNGQEIGSVRAAAA